MSTAIILLHSPNFLNCQYSNPKMQFQTGAKKTFISKMSLLSKRGNIYKYIFFVEILIYKSRRYDSSLSLRNFPILWYKYLIVFEKAFFIFETWLFCRSLLNPTKFL